MSEEQAPEILTAQVLIPRKNGNGFYAEGDRVLAVDLAGGSVERVGIVGLTGDDGRGKKYMVIRYGDEPFTEGFIATAGDIIEDLPDPENEEQLLEWLEGGA